MAFEIDELISGYLHAKEYLLAVLTKAYEETLGCIGKNNYLCGPGDHSTFLNRIGLSYSVHANAKLVQNAHECFSACIQRSAKIRIGPLRCSSSRCSSSKPHFDKPFTSGLFIIEVIIHFCIGILMHSMTDRCCGKFQSGPIELLFEYGVELMRVANAMVWKKMLQVLWTQ